MNDKSKYMGEKKMGVANKTVDNVKDKTIREFFKLARNIVIPANQRPYSWEDKQVKEFLEDLEYARKRKNEYKHYFNMVTFLREKENIEIYDGQQRITTTYLVLLIFYKIYKYTYGIKKNDIATSLEFLESYESSIKELDKIIYTVTGSYQTKKLSLYDKNEAMLRLIFSVEYSGKDDFLRQLKLGMSNGNINSNSNGRIFTAIEQIFAAIERFGVDDKNNKENERRSDYKLTEHNSNIDILNIINEYIEILLDNFQIITAEITSTEGAYKVFELVNHRGKELSDFDLVKNYFFQIVSEDKEAISELDSIIKELFQTLGDYVEDAIKKHWLIFFNKNNFQKYGQYNKIFESIKYGIENNENHQKAVFDFLRDMKKNLVYIENYYIFIKMNEHDFCSERYKKEFGENSLNYESLKRIFVFKELGDYDYLDYYLYYLLLITQQSFPSKNYRIDDEYKKVISFYLVNSVTKERMSELTKYNYKLGALLSNLTAENDFDMHFAFAKGLSDAENDKGTEDITKLTFARKLIAPEVETKGKRLKLIFAFIYDSEKYKRESLFDKFYPKGNSSNRKIIEEEHIIPLSEKNSKTFSRFDFTAENQESLFKSRMDWLGNKLVIDKSTNIGINDNFEKKLNCYSDIIKSDPVVFKFFLILAQEYLDRKTTEDDIKDKIAETKSEIYKKYICNKRQKNEEVILKVEEMWRKEIGKMYEDEDFLQLDKLWKVVREYAKA